MSVYAKLARIQARMKAPKNLYNSYGKYKYRNAEGILEAFKPFIETEQVSLIVGDAIKEIGSRFYVEATAILVDLETGEIVQNTAYAREEDTKKGMDGSQITGTASSYARKYALNGLFLLDDTKDADTDEYHRQTEPKKAEENEKNANLAEKAGSEKIDSAKIATIRDKMKKKGVKQEASIASHYKVSSIEELTVNQWLSAMKLLDKYKEVTE